jgi:hypothetical protein
MPASLTSRCTTPGPGHQPHRNGHWVTEQVQTRQQTRQLNAAWKPGARTHGELRESEAQLPHHGDAATGFEPSVGYDRYASQAFLDFVGLNLEQYVATGWAARRPRNWRTQTTLETTIRRSTSWSTACGARRPVPLAAGWAHSFTQRRPVWLH